MDEREEQVKVLEEVLEKVEGPLYMERDLTLHGDEIIDGLEAAGWKLVRKGET